MTSPPFGVSAELVSTFEFLGTLVTEGGSMVIVHGNAWEPPNMSVRSLQILMTLARATGLELHQQFVVEYELPRMSPSVKEQMKAAPRRAPDMHGHAWW